METFESKTEEHKPIAYVTGYHDGRCVIEPLNRAMVLPTGMALYADLQPAQEAKRERGD